LAEKRKTPGKNSDIFLVIRCGQKERASKKKSKFLTASEVVIKKKRKGVGDANGVKLGASGKF